MKKNEHLLNSKTPQWFKEWHSRYFIHYARTTRRNEKWIYVILIAIIGSSVLDNSNSDLLVRLISMLWGS